MICRSFSNKNHFTVKPLYTTIVRPILETVSPAWNPYMQEDIAKRAERLCDPRIMFQDLSQRRLRADMCEMYKILYHEYRIEPDKFFTLSDDNLRGHSFKLSKQRSRTDLRKNNLSNKVVTRRINWKIKL